MAEAVGELAYAGVADPFGLGAVRNDGAAPDDPAMGAETVLRHDAGLADLVEWIRLD
jgi:hypothetical protein